jgi:hypothetical protein
MPASGKMVTTDNMNTSIIQIQSIGRGVGEDNE